MAELHLARRDSTLAPANSLPAGNRWYFHHLDALILIMFLRLENGSVFVRVSLAACVVASRLQRAVFQI